MRWAGEALAFLGDNALTRGWNDVTTNVVIRPVEEGIANLAAAMGGGGGADALLADDTQARVARRILADLEATGGKLKPETLALLREHVNPDFEVSRFEAALPLFQQKRLEEEARVNQLTSMLQFQKDGSPVVYLPGVSEADGVIRGRTEKLRDALLEGDMAHALTDIGEPIRQYVLGSPVAAYAATGGAGALGVAGLQALMAELAGEEQPPAKREQKEKKEPAGGR